MGDPKAQLVTMPLAVGMDNVSLDEVVQLAGERPRLVESRNTRLSKVPGLVSKAPGATRLANGLTMANCGGLVPVSKGESTLLSLLGDQFDFTEPQGNNKRVVGSALRTLLPEAGIPNSQRDGYYPAQVKSAGVVSSAPTNFNAACCYVASSGLTYFLHNRASLNGALMLTVIGDDGRTVMPSQEIAVYLTGPATTATWFGLSAHGTTVLVWYVSAGVIYARTLSVSASFTITLGTATAIYTPNSLNWLTISIDYEAADTANAYLVCRNSGTANSIEVLRVTVATLAIAQQVTIAVGGAWDQVSIAYLSGAGVLVGVSRTSGSMNQYELNSTTLATTWSIPGTLYQGITSCGFHKKDTGPAYRVFAVSRTTGATPGTNSTHMVTRNSAGVFFEQAYIKSQRQIAQMVSAKVGDRIVPVLTCVNQWGNTGSYDPTSVNFVSETAVEMYTPGAGIGWACVARLGTDLVARYPGSNVSGDYLTTAARSAIASGSKILVTYLAENVEEGITAFGYSPRYAWLDLGNLQPRYALTDAGASIVAGAFPASWDGSQVTEHSPLRAPVISATPAGGAGPAWTNGTYLLAVVVLWRDAFGTIRRSAPSNVVSATTVGSVPLITAYLSESMQGTGHPTTAHPHPMIQLLVYASEPNGLVLYAQPTNGVVDRCSAVENAWRFSTAQPVVDAFHPAIYTDGSATQELPAFCPNACIDVAVVADRAWLIDAERRGCAPYSKPKRRGIAFEFNPDQFVNFPANAGDLMAVVGYNDVPVFLSRSGIWVVSGPGPDALLQPPLFAEPAQVSDVACTQTASVLRTPVGVLFVSDNRFALYNGVVEVLNDIDPGLYGTVVGTAVFRKQHEVVFFMSQGYCWVYNWQAGALTLWDQTVTGVSSITGVAQVPNTGKVLYFGGGELWLMDPDTVSATAQISLRTGWLSLGGAQDWNTLANLLLHAKRAGAHALQIDIAVDYRDDVVSSKTYSAAEVLTMIEDAVGLRYDAFPEPPDQNARAVRVTLTESGATGEAFQPIHLTLEVLKQSGKSLRSISDAARK